MIVNIILGAFKLIMAGVTAAQWLWNAAMLTKEIHGNYDTLNKINNG